MTTRPPSPPPPSLHLTTSDVSAITNLVRERLAALGVADRECACSSDDALASGGAPPPAGPSARHERRRVLIAAAAASLEPFASASSSVSSSRAAAIGAPGGAAAEDKPSARERRSFGVSPAAVQRVMDAHMAAVEACSGDAPEDVASRADLMSALHSFLQRPDVAAGLDGSSSSGSSHGSHLDPSAAAGGSGSGVAGGGRDRGSGVGLSGLAASRPL